MSKHNQSDSVFTLEGRFLGFLMEDGYKFKHLRLMTAQGEHCIKLSKEARASVGGVLLPGTWVAVSGETRISHKTGQPKYKAFQVRITAPHASEPPAAPAPTPATPAAGKPQTILVCQKSDCMKRGGKAICQALAETLHDRDLTDQVKVRGTGCMKHCKAGPNVIINKTRYSRISANDIPALVEEHFPPAVQPTSEPARVAHPEPIEFPSHCPAQSEDAGLNVSVAIG